MKKNICTKNEKVKCKICKTKYATKSFDNEFCSLICKQKFIIINSIDIPILFLRSVKNHLQKKDLKLLKIKEFSIRHNYDFESVLEKIELLDNALYLEIN